MCLIRKERTQFYTLILSHSYQQEFIISGTTSKVGTLILVYSPFEKLLEADAIFFTDRVLR